MFDFASLVFYVLAGLVALAGVLVVSSRNPVHSVLFLIFAFFNAAGLFLLLGAEYVAMTLVIVYVGAVAVLFLFVVMMLDINLAQMREGFLKYLPLGIGIAVLLFAEFYLVVHASMRITPAVMSLAQYPVPADVTNTEALGHILYTDFVFGFQVAGVILLVAMIGAIVLTLRHRPDARRQNITKQVNREPKDTLRIVSVKTGEGV